MPSVTSAELSNPAPSIPRLAVAPNPASGQVTFILDGPAGEYRLEVFDVRGRQVWTKKLQLGGVQSISVHWRQSRRSTAGIYVARVTSVRGGQVATGKFAVQP